jgi:hypothetical protein
MMVTLIMRASGIEKIETNTDKRKELVAMQRTAPRVEIETPIEIVTPLEIEGMTIIRGVASMVTAWAITMTNHHRPLTRMQRLTHAITTTATSYGVPA